MRHANRLTLLFALALIPATAAAFVQPVSRVAERIPIVARPPVPAPVAATVEPAAWRAFRDRHGDWRATWTERAASPRLASGPPIALLDTPADPVAVDRAVRGFVAANADLFGAPGLDLVRCARAGRVWYVSYRQSVRGVPVLFEDWEFRVGRSGGLMAFRAGERGADARVETRPQIGAGEARDRARLELGLDPATSRIEGGDNLFLMAADGGLRLVREVRARSTEPPANWIVLVDAADGRVRWRHDRVRYQVSGTVTGDVHTNLPSELPTAQYLPNLGVSVEPGSAVTDLSGQYSAPASGSVTVGMQLSGPFCDVNRQDMPDAAFSTTVNSPAVVDHFFFGSNSHDAERDVFYHIERVHAELKTLDPGFVGNDYAMPCAVNFGSTCNAFWDGFGVNFFQAGDGCVNTGTMPDVIYHEYGHAVNDNLYIQAGSGFGMTNGVLHEGLADVLAAFMQDSPVAGKGFYGPGTFLRYLDNTLRWPEDRSGDSHATGLILAGALWDLRQSVGLATAARLAHFAKYGRPDDFDEGVAMGEFFVETLIADDDDDNLANGTPNDAAIADAFNAHGIGTGYLLQIVHAPPGDLSTPSPHALYAQISSGPLGNLVPGSQKLWYSINGSPYGPLTMTPTGNPNQFLVMLPAPEGSIVRYYIQAAESFGGIRTEPNAGAGDPHLFLAGSNTSFLVHDHEFNAGWSVGFPGDGASTGIWEWTEPVGVDLGGIYSQPETNHTYFGVLCYVTGNAVTGDPPGTNDVDDGATTVATGVLDLTGAGPNPLIEYYRWYSNQLGNAPFEDTWRVYITNDGGIGWFPVETTSVGESAWRRVVFFVRDFVTPTDLVRLRFTAEDVGEPSLVEAAVDDFRILSFDNPALDAASAPVARPAGISASPNPSAAATRIEFRVAETGPATVALYDVSGRLVRTLFTGSASAGPQVVRWDGRDRHGAPVANGLYLARLTSGGRDFVCRIARTR